MRSKIAKKVRSIFEQCLRDAYPDFDRISGVVMPPGDRVFEWQMQKHFNAYLMLCLHTNQDSFTLDVAWSKMGRFPTQLISVMNPFPVPECELKQDTPVNGEFRTRIGSLWAPHKDRWWKVTDQPEKLTFDEILAITADETPPNEDLIRENVNDAIGRVRDYAIPYVKESCRTYAFGN